VETTFLDLFYRTTELLKNNYKQLAGFIFGLSFVKSLEMTFAGSSDATTIITVGLTQVLIGSLIQVIFFNFFLALLRGEEFSIKKAFWDFPTFIFYSLGFALVCLLGFVALIIPGLLVVYFYSFSPVVSILFDEGEEGIMHKTKRMVSKNYSLYTIVFVIYIVWEGVGQSMSQILSIFQRSALTIAPMAIIHSMISLVVMGLVIAFLDEAYKKLSIDQE